METEKYTVPGEALGTEEEYMAGKGTYIEKGIVHASLDGEFNPADRFATVANKGEMATWSKGTVVIGIVESMSDMNAMVRIVPIEHIEKSYRKALEVKHPHADAMAGLHVSSITKGYVKEIRSMIRIGDIIKAVVTEINIRNNMIDISTSAGPELGVVVGCCTKCRKPMERRDRELYCPRCDRLEMRKISSDYGRIV